jgi:hypothetical protein
VRKLVAASSAEAHAEDCGGVTVAASGERGGDTRDVGDTRDGGDSVRSGTAASGLILRFF